jgi:uncharacterized protein YcgL (UPF0745 family)
MYFYGLFLAMRAGSFMYFSATNPFMKYGGVMGESKYKVLRAIPRCYVPKTVFVHAPISSDGLMALLQKEELPFPIIIKPDVGERGRDVELIHSRSELHEYLKTRNFDLIVQQYIPDEMEFGILYHKVPGNKKGKVTSIVRKGFLTVTGDGKSTLRELINREIRAAKRAQYLHVKHRSHIDSVPSMGSKTVLEPIGNHSRGTTFLNANDMINSEINRVFDRIASQIEGYYYGRFDLKVPSEEDLYCGKNIKIFELNGVSSEVAHVYDPDYKLGAAYRDIARHMRYIFLIGTENHARGVRYDSLCKFLRDLWAHLRK